MFVAKSKSSKLRHFSLKAFAGFRKNVFVSKTNLNNHQKTKAFLRVLSRSVQIHTDLLLKIESGGLNENRKTWVHPQVAINIAQWISP
jgi:hypothetical protein